MNSPVLESDDVSRPVTRDWVRLVFLSAGALIIFRGIDTNLYRLLAPHNEALAALADLRLTSILAIGAVALMTRPRVGWHLALPDRRLMPWTALWLAGAFAAVHFAGIGKVTLLRWQDTVTFLTTGLVAEELLCRGLVFDAASRIWGVRNSSRPSGAVLWSAAVFALMHHQHHGFRFDVPAWLQVAWTFPFGVLLGWMTERTRSFIPAIAIHFLNNLLVTVA